MTVGVTTHNEQYNIQGLLDRLSHLDEEHVQIILYDDASTDGTASSIALHPLSRQRNFEAHLADANFGSPSVGRQFIADRAKGPYVTFVDGDDLIDPKALAAAARRLVPGFDIIVTPFVNGRQRYFPEQIDPERPVSPNTITRLLSGIGGKIYNRDALLGNLQDEIKGRSEDVRLNMRILLAGFDRVLFQDTDPFYLITSSRKSMQSRNILLPEIADRIRNYRILKDRYGLDDTYLKALHRNLLTVARDDTTLSEHQRKELCTAINLVMPFRLRTIIHLVHDISTIG
ncbi:glycosyltransferase family 2 protein, partial [Microvirga roseola]|uniref:glycosyltransferase family 2 protein n=1 Tax=Microvirga roseola TaxID=2883126 RepID=UPI001E53A8F7